MRLSTILLVAALALPLICVGADNEHLRSITRADQDDRQSPANTEQWYGTQYVQDSGGKFVLYTINESAVTDADRIQMAVPTLADAKKKAGSFSSGK
jgi:hypothetical protein